MPITKVLCPIDFSPGSRDAVRIALQLVDAHHAELCLLHVWQIPALAYGGFEGGVNGDVLQQIVDDAQRELAAIQQYVTTPGRKVTAKLIAGIAWDAIVKAAEEDTDLIVMGSHGRGGLSRFLLGSTAEKVVRHAPCSVLVVRGTCEQPFRSILCATDLPGGIDVPMRAATTIAMPGGTGITVLHVVDVPETPETPRVASWCNELEAAADALLQRRIDPIRSSVSVGKRLRRGKPATEILAQLDAHHDLELVVVGTHGRTGIKRLLLGSVAERVVRHAPCSVLVARERNPQVVHAR